MLANGRLLVFWSNTALADRGPTSTPATAVRSCWGPLLRGEVEVVRLLVEHGADVNAQDNDGYTALLAAAVSGAVSGAMPGAVLLGPVELVKVEIVRLLVEHGADVNAQDNDGYTALLVAAMLGDVEVVRLLVEHGADVNAQDNDGRTALTYCQTLWEPRNSRPSRSGWGAGRGSSRSGWGAGRGSVDLLVEHGADVNAQDNNGNTALCAAARCWRGGGCPSFGRTRGRRQRPRCLDGPLVLFRKRKPVGHWMSRGSAIHWIPSLRS